MKDKSFPLDWKTTKMHAFTGVDESILWHKRFGHFGYASIKHMHHEGLAINMPAIHECVMCVRCFS